MDLDDSELYWTRKKKGLATEKETEKETEEYIRSLESKLNKEKEKNKELSEKVTQNICNRVEAEVLEEYRLKVQNSISKDKIREKIEYLEKEIEEKQENGLDFTLIHEHEIDTNGIIKVLQELLEERN